MGMAGGDMSKILSIFLAVSFVFVASCQVKPEPVADWTMWGGNPGGNRVLAVNDALTSQQRPNLLAWRYKTDGGVDATPAIWDNKLYVGSRNGHFYCLDVRTGERIWEVEYQNSGEGPDSYRIPTSPVVVDGKVYFGAPNYKFVCLDALTGKQIWDFIIKDYFRSAITYANDLFYFCDFGGRCYCLGRDGKLKWSYETDGSYPTSVCADEKNRVFFGIDETLYCLDGLSGKELWKFEGKQNIASLVYCNYRIYFKCDEKYLYNVNAEDGSIIWKHEGEDYSDSIPLVLEDCIVNMTTENCLFLDKDTGKTMYKNDYGSDESAPIAYGDSIYYASCHGEFQDFTFVRVEAQTGKIIWKMRLFEACESYPVIVGSKVCLGGRDGSVICVDIDNGGNFPLYNNGITSNPIQLFNDDKLIVGVEPISYYSYSMRGSKNGEVVWVTPEYMHIYDYNWPGLESSHCWYHKDTIFFVTDNDNDDHNPIMHCLEWQTGKEIWKYELGNFWVSTIDDQKFTLLNDYGETKRIALEDGKITEATEDSQPKDFQSSFKPPMSCRPKEIKPVLPGYYLLSLCTTNDTSKIVGYVCLNDSGKVASSYYISKKDNYLDSNDTYISGINVFYLEFTAKDGSKYLKMDVNTGESVFVDENSLPDDLHVSRPYHIGETKPNEVKYVTVEDKELISKIGLGTIKNTSLEFNGLKFTGLIVTYSGRINVVLKTDHLFPYETETAHIQAIASYSTDTWKMLWRFDGSIMNVNVYNDVLAVGEKNGFSLFDGRNGKLLESFPNEQLLMISGKRCVLSSSSKDDTELKIRVVNLDNLLKK